TNTERVVAIGNDGGRHAIPMRWGLVPFWAKDIKTGLTLFNWRSEEVMAKRTFAEPFKRGRRWEQWHGPKDAPLPEPLLSFSIATTSPNKIAAPIHNRMPVLFTADAQWDAWLDPAAKSDDLMPLLTPAPDDLLEARPVTRDLLRIKEPGPDVLRPTR
ncbi:MAG: SOS response-associated peptidase, partial [Gemmataceae bacterium]